MTGEWVYGAIVALSVLHLLALAYAYRNQSDASGVKPPDRSASAADGKGAEHTHDEDVECPECGAVNARSYRFCRRCVTELPGRVSVLEQSTWSEGRRTL